MVIIVIVISPTNIYMACACSDVQLLVHTAASCSLHIGLSSDLPVERDHPLLSALVAAMVRLFDWALLSTHVLNNAIGEV